MESRKNLKPLRPQKKRRKERKGLNTTKQWSTPYRRGKSGMCSRRWGIFAGVEAGGTAASVGLSYLMHRTGHHKLERWVSIAHIGVTGFGAARNYALKTHRASAP